MGPFVAREHRMKFSDLIYWQNSVSTPIYCELGHRQKHSARLPRPIARGDLMSAIHDVDVDLATFCGRIGNLYGRHGLCPPFELRRIAADWMASGIALSHIVAVIDRHLTDHRRRYNSGSGDALFSWLAEHVRRTWDKRTSLHHGPNQLEQRCR
jgi:hypothetical protein